MLGGLLALLSAVTFAFANATARRGVLTGSVLQAVAISCFLALPLFLLALAPFGISETLRAFDGESVLLLATAGVIHFAAARYANYRAVKAIGANLVGPVQNYSLVITLILAVFWLGEAVTALRIVGVIMIVVGPLMARRAARGPAAQPLRDASVPTFTPNYREGYFFAGLCALGYGVSPILIGMALPQKTLANGIAAGFISHLAATVVVVLPMLMPSQWPGLRFMDWRATRWFVVSGVSVSLSQMFRYMAFALMPIAVATSILQLHLIFRVHLSAVLNRDHEIFGGGLVVGTVVSLAGAVVLAVDAATVIQALSLSGAVADSLGWSWRFR
jgi:uncharacterized membrane protein